MPPTLIAQIGSQVSNAAKAGKDAVASQSDFVSSILTSIDVVRNIIISAIILVVFYIIGRLIARRVVRTLHEAKGETLYPDMVSLINRFILYGSLFVGFAVIVQFIFKLDFIQVIGFFGLGISFAFKDLLANLIAGAVIIIQNRFRVGDFIQIGKDGIKGKIMDIQTRATILKAIDGTEIIIPNAQLMVKPVISYTAHHRRRISFVIGISFESDIDKAQKIAIDIMSAEEKVLKKPHPSVLTKNVGDSAVELDMRFWVDPQDKSKSWITIRSELVTKVKQAFDKNGIVIPFPIRDLRGNVGNTPNSQMNT